MTRCDFEYCIYHRNGECTLEEIQVNGYGMCEACILITVDKKILEEGKRMQLEVIEKERQYDDLLF